MDRPDLVNRAAVIQWLRDAGLTLAQAEESLTMEILNRSWESLHEAGFLTQEGDAYYAKNIAEELSQDEKLAAHLRGLIQWLYAIRGKDENLVIETAPDGISLCDAIGAWETATGKKFWEGV